MRYVRYLCIALANRGIVSLQVLPAEVSGLFAVNPSIELPLFIVILGSVLAGLLIGFVWEWIREYGERAEAAKQAREMRRLQRELDKLTAQKHEGKDEVIALLDKAS